MRAPARWRSGVGVLVLAGCALVLAGAAAGCSSPRNALGTSSSPCFRAVPVASDAVKHRGTLAGIRLVGSKQLARRPHLHELLSARAGHHVVALCIVSFHGRFRLDQVERPFGHAPPSGTGTYAVVVVSSPQNRLLGTLVLAHQPLPLRHEVLGPLPRAPRGPPSPTDGA